MTNKKAELTTQQLVTLIILIVSFVVILFLLFRLDLGKETESELCHNSVVLRGSSVLIESAIPLDCSRKYVCITKDGSCDSMTKPEIKKVKTDADVYQILADEMANCWWMFGEGKVDYVKSTINENLYCSICSQIAFDTSLKDISAFFSGQLDQNLFYDYLKNENYTSGKTYSEYLFGTNDVNNFKKQLKLNQTQSIDFETIDFSNQYFVLTGIMSDFSQLKFGAVSSLGGVLGGVVVTLGASNPVGWIVGGSFIGGVFIYKKTFGSYDNEILSFIIEGDGINNQFMAPTIIESNSDKFKALNCQEILTTA